MLDKLFDVFENWEIENCPVEIDDIISEITKLGAQDTIKCDSSDTDPKKLKGIFYSWTERRVLYGEPELFTLILYSNNVDITWQRVICAKELVHVCDRAAAKTMTEDELDGLLSSLLGTKKDEDYGLADFQAHRDKLALYEALPLLLPKKARDQEKIAFDGNRRNIAEIAKDAGLPEPVVKFMMEDEWEYVRQELYENCCRRHNS